MIYVLKSALTVFFEPGKNHSCKPLGGGSKEDYYNESYKVKHVIKLFLGIMIIYILKSLLP